MRTAGEERARWDAEWSREREAAIWGCPGMSWAEGVARDLGQIVPYLGLTSSSRVVLDLGCGPGRLAVPFAAAHPAVLVVGVDISEPVIGEARAAATAAGLRNARFKVGDGRRFPTALALDAAWSMLLFQHLEADTVRGYLGEVARVLRPGGVFRFQWVHGETDSPYSHDVGVEAMRSWCDVAGLVVEDMEPDPDWPTWAWATAVRTGG